MRISPALQDLHSLLADRRLGSTERVCVNRSESSVPLLSAATVEMTTPTGRKILAAGGAFSSEKALASAIGESIERHCLFSFDHHALEWSSYCGLRSEALDPEKLSHYREDVYGLPGLGIHRFSDRILAPWIQAHRLRDGRDVWVPAVHVFSELPSHIDKNLIWERPVSTGAAVHFCRDTSALTGLYEVIERDSLMLAWESGKEGQPLRASGELVKLIERVERSGFTVRISEIPNEFGVSVCVAGVFDSTGRRCAVGCGAAARHDRYEAAFRAFEEAALASQWITVRRELGKETAETVLADLRHVPEPVRHADYYGFSENSGLLNGLFGSSPPILLELHDRPQRTARERLNELSGAVSQKGYDVIIADVTPLPLREYGVRAVRVLVPGLVPMARGLRLRHLENPRLKAVLNPEAPASQGAPHPLA